MTLTLSCPRAALRLALGWYPPGRWPEYLSGLVSTIMVFGAKRTHQSPLFHRRRYRPYLDSRIARSRARPASRCGLRNHLAGTHSRHVGRLAGNIPGTTEHLLGELVGGLPVVSCSIALVLSLWETLEGIPLFPFLAAASINLAMFGLPPGGGYSSLPLSLPHDGSLRDTRRKTSKNTGKS